MLDRKHPVRMLLESARNGGKPSEQLMQTLENSLLSPAESLKAYRLDVLDAVNRIAKIGAQGQFAEASSLADAECDRIEARMTKDQAAVATTSMPGEDDAINDMVQRVFER